MVLIHNMKHLNKDFKHRDGKQAIAAGIKINDQIILKGKTLQNDDHDFQISL